MKGPRFSIKEVDLVDALNKFIRKFAEESGASSMEVMSALDFFTVQYAKAFIRFSDDIHDLEELRQAILDHRRKAKETADLRGGMH